MGEFDVAQREKAANPQPAPGARSPRRVPAGNRLLARMLMRNGIPFPFRYTGQGDATMTTVTEDAGGMVHYPRAGLPARTEEDAAQMSLVAGSEYADMPTGHRRNIAQSAVLGNVSPNQAAGYLGLPRPSALSWEWLHLVAFSIRETHVDALSAQSMQLMARTGQPQQIRENLVLGTAASNTAMLSYETAIKHVMRAEPRLRLNLFVAASKHDVEVPNTSGLRVAIPVATRIDYHFNFTAPDGSVSAPFVLAFDPTSHEAPPRSEYDEVVAAINRNLHESFTAGVEGMRTTGFASVG